MASVEDQIDELYQLPLAEFIPARGALAKSLGGDEAKRIKALKKPTVVPWAVNQLFWHARPVYDKLVARGAALRKAQVASLKGQRADVRQATEDHRAALRTAVREAEQLAAGHDATPDRDLLLRTLEALSLAVEQPGEPVGRLLNPLQPSGFEALAGVAIKPPAPAPAAEAPPARRSGETPAQKAAERRRAEEQARAERERATAIQKAEQAAGQARAREEETRRAWERARAELDAAERTLAAARHL